MLLAELTLSHDTNMSPVLAYVCTEPGCDHHFKQSQGYFTTSPGEKIVRDQVYVQKCPKDGLFMFIDSFDATGSKRQWKCAKMGCVGGTHTSGGFEIPKAKTAP